MPKLIILCGPSGAGKSTYADQLLSKQTQPSIIVSSDTIREELFGDASDLQSPDLVFGTAHKRIRAHLKNEETVIVDATNMTMRARRGILECKKNLSDITTECHVILSPISTCMSNQLLRDRQVPDDVIRNQIKAFALPEFWEGFDKIVFHNAYYEPSFLNQCVNQLDNIEQFGKYHIESAGIHTRMAVQIIKEMTDDDVLSGVMQYHDIGKYYTQTEKEGSYHFYGHGSVSTYLFLTGSISESCEFTIQNALDDRSSIYYQALLIMYHDSRYLGTKPRFIEHYGETMEKELQMIEKADTQGAITLEQIQNMTLLNFISRYPEWESMLSKPPFSLKIKRENDYVLFKYNLIESNMNYRLVQQSRGSIFKQHADNSFSYVCRPWDKFFNYGESQAATIDWQSARVLEKIDGSLCKMFYSDGEWHLATNATINAFHAPVSDTEMTFGSVFERALGMDIETFGIVLDKEYTYLFELTSQETQVVISYDDGVYYLSRIHTASGKEDFSKISFPQRINEQSLNIQYPKVFSLSSLDGVLAVTQKMSKDEEGVVINDKQGHRIKVKSPKYLIASHLLNNGRLSDKRLLKYMQENSIDDLIAYRPELMGRVEELKETLLTLAKEWESDWKQVSMYENKREFALNAKEFPSSSFLFSKYKDNTLTAADYLLSLNLNSLCGYVIPKLREQMVSKEESLCPTKADKSEDLEKG